MSLFVFQHLSSRQQKHEITELWHKSKRRARRPRIQRFSHYKFVFSVKAKATFVGKKSRLIKSFVVENRVKRDQRKELGNYLQTH